MSIHLYILPPSYLSLSARYLCVTAQFVLLVARQGKCTIFNSSRLVFAYCSHTHRQQEASPVAHTHTGKTYIIILQLVDGRCYTSTRAVRSTPRAVSVAVHLSVDSPLLLPLPPLPLPSHPPLLGRGSSLLHNSGETTHTHTHTRAHAHTLCASPTNLYPRVF